MNVKRGAPKKKSAKHLKAKSTQKFHTKTIRDYKKQDESPERKAWRAAYLKSKRSERFQEMQHYASSLEEIELATNVAMRDRLEKLVQLRETLAQKLSDQQMTTVTEYLNNTDTKRAAMLVSGYAAVTARHTTTFRNANVKKYLAVTRKINEITTGVTAEFVLSEFTKLAKVSAQDLYDTEGNILPPHMLPPDVAAAVSEIKERSYIEGKGAHAKKITEVTYKLHNKLAALDALGKHTGIYEADNNQKQTTNKVLIMLPSNGRNKELLETHDVETRIVGEDGEAKQNKQ